LAEAPSRALQLETTEREGWQIRRLRILELVRPMRGGSRPWLVRCENGDCYVAKFSNNPQRVRVLANEMLAGRVARLIGIPAAEVAFVELIPELAKSCGNTYGDEAQRAPAPGLHFGSKFPGNPGQNFVIDFLPDRLLQRVRNLQQAFLGGFVFDKWTGNCDGRQLVFWRTERSARYDAMLIDQGFCFNDGDWSFLDSPVANLYARRVVYEGVRGLQSFEPYLSTIENLSPSVLEQCAQEIPEEWCDGDSGGPGRLAEELFRRRTRMRQAIVDAKNSSVRPFPNWR
jgi:hypothetical protein